MARTINYELKAQKIKGQIDELVTALFEERKNSFDENNKKIKIRSISPFCIVSIYTSNIYYHVLTGQGYAKEHHIIFAYGFLVKISRL